MFVIQNFRSEPDQTSFRASGQPNRRRRSGRASRECREGTRRKFPRRRCKKNHRRNRRGRTQLDPRDRRRLWHEPRRRIALARTPRDQQNSARGRFSFDCHDGFSRRGTAQHRQCQPFYVDDARTRKFFTRRHANRHRWRKNSSKSRPPAARPARASKCGNCFSTCPRAGNFCARKKPRPRTSSIISRLPRSHFLKSRSLSLKTDVTSGNCPPSNPARQLPAELRRCANVFARCSATKNFCP